MEAQEKAMERAREAEERRARARTQEWEDRKEGKVRTDMHCHECGKGFVAVFDFSVDGCHCLECPRCAHPHYRCIVDGRVTEERWNSGMTPVRVEPRCVWAADSMPAQTSVAAYFIRERWLNRGAG